MSENLGIDFSYKENARKAYYDIEVLYDIFTMLTITDGYITLHIADDGVYDSVSTSDLIAALRQTAVKYNEKSLIDAKIDVRRVGHNGYTASHLKKDMLKLIGCKSMWDSDPKDQFVEYMGWNSNKYDLVMLIALYNLLAKNNFTTQRLRHISDSLIKYSGPPWKLAEYLETSNPLLGRGSIKKWSNWAAYSDGHIDLAQLARSTSDGADSSIVPGLKKEGARNGDDIVIDSAVSDVNRTVRLTDSEFIDFCVYNFNDVIITQHAGQNKVLQSAIVTRDIVRKMYDYTSAKALPSNKIFNWTAPERDTTEANLAGLVLIGKKRSKPEDYESVSYQFPIPDGHGGLRKVDLLEHMVKHEKFMHPMFYKFFDHFRGKDTRDKYADKKIKKAQPINGNAQLNIPYYRDGQPVDAYIRISTGGAHGSVMAGLSKMSDTDIEQWIISDVGALAYEKPTIDVKNILHIDWSSFYPVMASKMELYKTKDGVDRYTGIIDYRIHIKKSIPHEIAEWTDEHYEMKNDEQGLKLLLNAATGAGNMHSPYSNLPLDNKTQSMRLIGNLHIWCLGQRLVEAGAYIISTNTDGLYICNMTVEESQKVIDGYVAEYGMGVDPEPMDRFINRDTSNRIEFQGKDISVIGGKLRHGKDMTYNDRAIGSNITYPLAVGHAVLEYFKDEDWLTKPYDRQKLRDIIERLFHESESLEAWWHIHAGTKARRLTLDNKRAGTVNRVVMTKEGSQLGLETSRIASNDDISLMWPVLGHGLQVMVQHLNNESARLVQEKREKYPEKDIPDALHAELANSVPESYDICFVMKKDKDSDEYQLAPEHVQEVYYHDEFDKSLIDGARLGIRYERQGEMVYEPVKLWKQSKLPDYTSTTGKILNSRQSILEFDKNELDLEAYTQWAENMLDGWKVTADIPEIGLHACDDTVVPNTKPRATTKAQRAIERIENMYQLVIDKYHD